MNLLSFFTKERELKMIWKIQKRDEKSFLVGSTHFFPFSFKKSLTRYIAKADTVILEGPLDQSSMDKVVKEGQKGDKTHSLHDALDARTINEINKLEYTIHSQSYLDTYMRICGESTDTLYNRIKDKKAWMAFFEIWAYYREKNGWIYTMDRDALNIANEQGKVVHFLETIEEQIDALNGIPLERIVSFLKKVGRWDEYTRRYVKYYLKGDPEKLIALATDFPTYCDSIIDKRDPILYERMKPYLEQGNTLFIVGITHIPGIKKRLVEEDYTFL